MLHMFEMEAASPSVRLLRALCGGRSNPASVAVLETMNSTAVSAANSAVTYLNVCGPLQLRCFSTIALYLRY